MEKIKLYHGTDYIGLTNILNDGVIDARSGRRTGETKGKGWKQICIRWCPVCLAVLGQGLSHTG